MRPVNPLLVSLAESEAEGCDAREALVRLMMALLGSMDFASVELACLWDEKNGHPTYTKLRAWARRFAADPENAEVMLPLLDRHSQVVAEMTDDDAAAWGPYFAAGRE